MDRFQKTLSQKVVVTGKGLHSGRIVRLEISPAEANTGIVFQRTDSAHADPVLAHAKNITATQLSTTIGSGASSVATIEHLMAAFAGLGIDNALVRLNGPEVPIMDGSAAPFVEKLMEAGFCVLAAKRRMLVVKREFEVTNGDQFLRIVPATRPRIRCSIEFEQSIIGHQAIDYQANLKTFLQVAEARTFCHLNDVTFMRQRGLALGGSLENAIVVSDTGVLNEEGLRSDDEFVRHKLLDLVGDLYLMGGQIIGEVIVHKPGHTLHAEFMTALLANQERVLSVVEPAKLLQAEDERAASAAPVLRPAFATYGFR